MKYVDFLEQVKSQVSDRVGEEARICICPVTKNNALELDGLSIMERDDNVSPVIYLNGYYQEFQGGRTMERIVDQILETYQRGKTLRYLNPDFYTDIRQVKGRLLCRLVNFEKNRRLLETVPHRRFLDLAIVYCCTMEHEKIGTASILVRNDHLALWGLEDEELHEIAVDNMRRQQPFDFMSMEEMLQSLLNSNETAKKEGTLPLYVLTNREKHYGAVWMTDPGALAQIGEELNEDYYILPSSVHECMVLPASMEASEQALKKMVTEINATQVAPEEVLADSVYRYDRKTGSLRIAAV